jgi:hypothetical protein
VDVHAKACAAEHCGDARDFSDTEFVAESRASYKGVMEILIAQLK